MHAYLIVGVDVEEKAKKAKQISKSFDAKLLEFPLQNIKEARDLGKFLSLTPSFQTAILIKNIDQASAEAVNAFLKNLEEKENYIFILTAMSKYSVLPTVLSRCQVFAINPSKRVVESSKKVEKFLKITTSERLLFIEDYKARDEAREFINSLITIGGNLLKKAGNKAGLAKVLSACLETKKVLSTNANPTLALTDLVISLDD